MASLMITTTHLGGTRIQLGAGPTTIGRQRDCERVLDHPTVSRRHAVIREDARGILLLDLGSRNGTSVNGVRVAGAVRLQVGDRVAFGRVEALVAATAAGSEPEPVQELDDRVTAVGRLLTLDAGQ